MLKHSLRHRLDRRIRRVWSIPVMSDKTSPIEEALAKRDRHLRACVQHDSPQDRIDRFRALQQASFALLQSSPQGYQHFLRRNYHLRRPEVVDGQWQPVSTALHPPLT